MSRETLCFSIYSDISKRISAFSLSKRLAARALASSVLPTPDGPENINEPTGRLGSLSPALLRRTAFATADTASFCPITRL